MAEVTFYQFPSAGLKTLANFHFFSLGSSHWELSHHALRRPWQLVESLCVWGGDHGPLPISQLSSQVTAGRTCQPCDAPSWEWILQPQAELSQLMLHGAILVEPKLQTWEKIYDYHHFKSLGLGVTSSRGIGEKKRRLIVQRWPFLV